MNNGYYEQDGGEKRKGGSIGSYIATAVIFTVVGALLASFCLPGIYAANPVGSANAGGDRSAYVAPQATAAPAPAETQKPAADSQTDASLVIPAAPSEPSTAPQESYVMPELDGEAPVIGDIANPLPDVIEQVQPCMVGIINYAYYEKYETNLADATGSGFIISSDGFIITNAHVVDGYDAVGVLLNDGSDKEYVAAVVGYDKKTDIAVLKIDPDGHELTPVKVGDSTALRVGDFVLALGDPTGRELAGTATFGIVSALDREINVEGRTNNYIQVDAPLNPGNSGGALFSVKGEVIGVVSAKTSKAGYDEDGILISAEGLGFVLPINKAVEVAEELIKSGSVKRTGLGISVITMDEISAIDYQVPQGILIYTVTKDGPGHKAGLQINDIIIECEGERTIDQTIFVREIEERTVGDSLHIKVWRYGEEIEFTVVLGDLNTLGSELVDGKATFDWNKEAESAPDAGTGGN